MKRLSVVLMLMLIAIAAPQRLFADDAKNILENLEKKYKSLQDVTIRFTQRVQFGVTKNEDTFKGTLLLKKGNKYRIETEHQTLVTDGKSVWSYSPDNRQVIIDKFKEDKKSITPDKILVNVPDRYTTTALGKEKVKENELTVLKLIPKDPSSNIQWMKVWIDTDEWVMRKVQYEDVSENVTTYVIDDVAMNTGVPEGKFQFAPPADAQVIDLR